MTTEAHAGLISEVRAWIAEDPDARDRAELEALVRAEDYGELGDRFAGRLHFGTAGLRGAVGAGPNRMNRAVVRATTAALARWLGEHQRGAAGQGVVVGCDARHRSAELADETTAVLVGAGLKVHRLEDSRPTPLLAFSVLHLGAAAGVMITASHNPPADNGYKLYLSDGIQIVPPVDEQIEELTARVGSLEAVPLGDVTGPLVTRHGPEVERAYLAALAAVSPAPAAGGAASLSIAYTPLHGVGAPMFREALRLAGFPAPSVVAAQEQPDPDFPTVPFPNPEERGAMDLVLAEGRRIHAGVVVANDPDADRLAVAVPAAAAGGFRQLNGDEVGSLLGDYLIEKTAGTADPGSRLVASTIVSSSMLSKIAAAAGIHYAETLTGFKWVARSGDLVPGSRFLFGYEEALGYCVGTVVRDKDGIGAALAWLGMSAEAAARSEHVLARLDELERRHGVHRTSQLSIRSEEPLAAMKRLRVTPPQSFGAGSVLETIDLSSPDDVTSTRYAGLPASDVLVYLLDEARIVVRPSGTEPKLKIYFEVVEAVRGGELDVARRRADRRMAELRGAAEGLVAGG